MQLLNGFNAALAGLIMSDNHNLGRLIKTLFSDKHDTKTKAELYYRVILDILNYDEQVNASNIEHANAVVFKRELFAEDYEALAKLLQTMFHTAVDGLQNDLLTIINRTYYLGKMNYHPRQVDGKSYTAYVETLDSAQNQGCDVLLSYYIGNITRAMALGTLEDIYRTDRGKDKYYRFVDGV